MNRILIIFLALILVACGVAPAAPTQQPVAAQPEPSQTAVVVVITATNAPPTEVPPTEPPPPTEVPPTAVPPTEPPPPTQAVAAAPTQETAADPNAPIKLDDKLGAGWFLNMTRSGDNISLRCQLYKQLKFTAQATSEDIDFVDFYYRIEDRGSGAIFDWVNAGKMVPDNEGNFTMTFSGEQIHANFRNFDLGWLDFQFVGYNVHGVLGRSEKIERQITYTKECPQ